MTIFTTAGVVIDAAHASKDGKIHGHTWVVWATVPGVSKSGTRQDVLSLQAAMKKIAGKIDHTMLPDRIAWSGELAAWFAMELIENFYDPLKVVVERPMTLLRETWLP